MPEANENLTAEAKLIHLEWQAPEFQKYEKGPLWFIIVGLIGLGIFAIALLMKNFIFAIMIIFAVFAIFVYAVKNPGLVTFTLDGNGLTIGEKKYSYDGLKSFWIFFEPPEIKELALNSKKWSTPLIRIPLGEQDPVAIRQALLKFIPEEKIEESIIDSLARTFKF